MAFNHKTKLLSKIFLSISLTLLLLPLIFTLVNAQQTTVLTVIIPQWQQDSMRRVREIRESDSWVQVATRMDIDEYAIMKRFASGARPSVSKALLDALHGKGAFRRFRDEIHRTGSEAAWQEFRSERIARDIRATLDTRGVKYRR